MCPALEHTFDSQIGIQKPWSGLGTCMHTYTDMYTYTCSHTRTHTHTRTRTHLRTHACTQPHPADMHIHADTDRGPTPISGVQASARWHTCVSNSMGALLVMQNLQNMQRCRHTMDSMIVGYDARMHASGHTRVGQLAMVSIPTRTPNQICNEDIVLLVVWLAISVTNPRFGDPSPPCKCNLSQSDVGVHLCPP